MGQMKKIYTDWLEDNRLNRAWHSEDGEECEDSEECRDSYAQDIENWSMDFDAFISRLILGCSNLSDEEKHGFYRDKDKDKDKDNKSDAQSDVKGDK